MVESLKKEPLGRDFYLYVNKSHTFGTDAVLLASFSKAKPKDKMVDLGTGCGIIPFLLLRDGLLERVVGVDISDEAIALAERTKNELKLEKFTPLNCDLKALKGKVEFGNNTLVTCNPPYKAPNAGIKSSGERERVARHETECTLRDIIEVSAKLLQTGGRLCMCHRPERLGELITLMSECKVEPKRLRLVCQRKGEEPWLVLIEGRRCGNVGLRIEPTLYVEQDGGWSKEMIEIYGAYKEAYL